MKKIILLSFVMFFFVSALFGDVEFTTIEEIIAHPRIGAIVTVEGFAVEYVPDPNGDYYILKSDFGNPINVNTDTEPKLYVRWCVKAYIQKDAHHNKPILIEKERWHCGDDDDDDDKDSDGILDVWEVANRLDPTDPNDAFLDFDDDGISNFQEYRNGTDPNKFDGIWYENPLYIALGILIIILIIVLIFRLKPSHEKPKKPSVEPEKGKEKEEPVTDKEKKEPETVKLPLIPVTYKFIPGKFVIVSDMDKDTEFRVSGFPTNEGGIVTIGRSSVKDERSWAHIKLVTEHYPTVSRKQAEIIYANGKVYIRNISKINLTQVNGVAIESDQKKELKFGDVIKMGALELKYVK